MRGTYMLEMLKNTALQSILCEEKRTFSLLKFMRD